MAWYAEPVTGQSLLVLACHNPHPGVFEHVLRATRGLYMRDARLWTIGHHLVHARRVDLLPAVLRAGFRGLFDWNDDCRRARLTRSQHAAPLHGRAPVDVGRRAVCAGVPPAVCTADLTRRGADVNARNLSGQTPLYRAIRRVVHCV